MKRPFGTKQNRPTGTWKQLEWCRKVTDQVAFWPDRAAIQRELLAHLEDGTADLERIGFDRQLAEERTLAAMGDPVEVGKALNQAHKPWLGWLWQLSRGLMLVLAVIIVVTLFQSGLGDMWDKTAGQMACTEPPPDAQVVETEFATIYAAPRQLAEEEGHIVAEIDLWVHMHSVFHDGPEGLLRFLEVRDDQGVLYGNNVRDENGNWQETGYRNVFSAVKEGQSDSGWTDYHWIYQLHVEEVPEWVELIYPWGRNDWTLRITWEEG